MNDAVIEIMVERKPSMASRFGKYACLVLTILFALLSPFVGLFMALSAVATGFITYFLGLRINTEYEYSYFNKELEIDVIYSKQKRKHLATYNLNRLEAFGPVGHYKLDEFKNMIKRLAVYTSGKEENKEKVYSMIFSDGVRLDIEPTDELIDAIARFAPRKVFRN